MAEPKGILALSGAETEDEGEEMAEASPKERALEDFFAAGRAGEWSKAAAAFQRAYDLCAMKGSEESEPDGMLEG